MSMKKAESGCTLIEALVALSVLAVGIVFFLQTSLFSLKNASAGRRDLQSLAVAGEWMEILRARPWAEAVGGCERTAVAAEKLETAFCRVERGGETYYLTLERSLRNPLIEELTVHCSGPPGHRSRSITLESALEKRR